MGLLIAGIFGLIAGGLARTAMPGPDPLGIIGAILLGLLGAILGYLAGASMGGQLLGIDERSLFLAVTGSMATLFRYRAYAMRYAE